MNPTLRINVCRTYFHEAKSVIQLEKWHDVQVFPFVPMCYSQHLSQGQIDSGQPKGEKPEDTIQLGGCYTSCRGPGHVTLEQGLDPNLLWDQCFYMITSRSLVDHFTQQGGYVLSPGWLEEWRDHLCHWGFDQQTARDYFHESTTRLVLLDTGVDLESAERLRELGSYLDLPIEVVPVGLDFFRLFLKQTVLDWRYQHRLHQAKKTGQEAIRNTADYAMAFDLLTQLTRVMTEEEVIVQILDLFTMLFSLGSVAYYPVVGDQVKESFNCKPEEQEVDAIQGWFVSNQDDYSWTESRNGFLLQIAHQGQTVGVLRVDGILFPQYKHQYLNLSLSIARLCGLAISNARTYQKLQVAENNAQKEKQISETLRQVMQELTAHLDLGELLSRILKLLVRVIPFTRAAIFLQKESQLHFKVGIECLPSGETNPLSHQGYPLKIDPSWPINFVQTGDDLRVTKAMQKHLGWDGISSWMVVPFLFGENPMGYLVIGSEGENAYDQSKASLMQTFASEVAIAIENAHLFEEIQQLAITDSLTGLSTRRHFFELGEIEFERSRRYNRPLSILMIDVDHFKEVNDTHGHAIGDMVLAWVAQCCHQNVRQPDVIGRYGGDEFVLLMPETSLLEAQALAERIRAASSDIPVHYDHGDVHITITLGAASLDDGCKNLMELLQRSDEALLDAKRASRNSVKVWEE